MGTGATPEEQHMSEDHPNTDRISRTNSAQMASQAEKRARCHRAPHCGLCSHYKPEWPYPVIGRCRSRRHFVLLSRQPPPEPDGSPCASFHDHRPDELIQLLLGYARFCLNSNNHYVGILCNNITQLLLESRPHDLREHGPDHGAEGSWWNLYYETKEEIVNLFQCMKSENYNP